MPLRFLHALVLAGLSSSTGCTQPEAPVVEPVSEPGTVGPWEIEIPPLASTPDVLPTDATLWLPGELEPVEAVVIFMAVGRGHDLFTSEEWRAFASERSLALVAVDLVGGEEGSPRGLAIHPDQAASQLVNVLETLAATADRPRIAEVPLVLFGHSVGGFQVTGITAQMPERVAAYVPWHGAIHETYVDPQRPYYDDLRSARYREVPGLFQMAEYDPVGLTRPILDWFEEARDASPRWTLAVQADADHWDLEGANALILPFVASALDAPRFPAETRGVLEIAYREDQSLQITDAALLDTDPDVEGTVSWMPDPEFAALWLVSSQEQIED